MSQTRVLCVANAKGGVGKSTVTILLAAALAKQKKQKVLILDTDSQASISEWLAAEQQAYGTDAKALIDVEALDPKHVQMYLEKFGENYDTIFIDIPRMTNSMNETSNVQLLYFADSILIPILGSRLDVMSTSKFFQVVSDAEKKKIELGFSYQILGFLNKENQRKDNQQARDILHQQAGIKILDTSLRDLKLFTTPSLFESILDTSEGRRRFEPFFNEVCKQLKL